MPEKKPMARKRDGAIDALRGFAAVLVILAHAGVPYSATDYGDFGRIGVLLFFIISGYCIFLTANYADHEGESRRFQVLRFILKRGFRLYPAYWVSIGLAVLILRPEISNSAIVLNMTMIQKIFMVPDAIGIYWTLFVEILFYAFMLLLIVLRKVNSRKSVVRLFYGLLIATLVFSLIRFLTGVMVPFAYVLFMATFILGGVYYFNRKDGFGVANSLLHTGTFLAFTLVISALVFADPILESTDFFSRHFGNYVIAAGIFVIGFFWLRPTFAMTSYLGAISYGMYLYHEIVMGTLRPYLPVDALSLSVPLYLLATIALSAAIHHLIEQPAIRLGNMLVRSVKQQLGLKAYVCVTD